MVPALFVFGLLLIPIGLWLERRRGTRPGTRSLMLDFRDPNVPARGAFVLVATLVNIVIMSVASFGAVEYSESQAFCGQTCHGVMSPEFIAHQSGPHARIHCVTCHVGPGTGRIFDREAEWLAATRSGDERRLPSARSLRPSTTCRPWRAPVNSVTGPIATVGDVDQGVLRVCRRRSEHPDQDDRAAEGRRVHSRHNGRKRHSLAHESRERCRVRRQRRETRADPLRAHEHTRRTSARVLCGRRDPRRRRGKPRRPMDCVDRHNRPAHTFGTTAERAVDQAIGDGRIDAKIPFIRREAVRVLRAAYPSHDVAPTQIERSLREAFNARLPHAVEESSLQRAIQVTRALYTTTCFLR